AVPVPNDVLVFFHQYFVRNLRKKLKKIGKKTRVFCAFFTKKTPKFFKKTNIGRGFFDVE
ncbi:MAG: hypothetical protein IKO42_03105, partial [Opitutales bacterium]|nr:hypothetical protein [Opitutales bacterium]